MAIYQLVETRLEPAHKRHECKLHIKDGLCFLNAEYLQLVNGLVVLSSQLLGLREHHDLPNGMVYANALNSVLGVRVTLNVLDQLVHAEIRLKFHNLLLC